MMVAALSGCGEDAKDCNGFWDKAFGREECAVNNASTASNLTGTPIISPDSKTKENVVTVSKDLIAKKLVEVKTGSKVVTNESEAKQDIQLVFGNDQQVNLLKNGQILILDPSEQLPLGLAAKVVDKKNIDGDKTQVGLEYVSITDIFEDLDLTIDPKSVKFGTPKFYPATGFTLKNDVVPTVKSGAKSVSVTDWITDTVFNEPELSMRALSIKSDEVAFKPKIAFAAAKKDGKLALLKSCDDEDLKASGNVSACAEVSMPLEIELSQLKFPDATNMVIKDGKLVTYNLNAKMRMKASVGLGVESKKLGDKDFSLSWADTVRLFNTGGTGKDVQDKRSLLDGKLELIGVPYDDDKILIGSFVFNLETVGATTACTVSTFGTGVAACAYANMIEGGRRPVEIQPALLITVFVTSSGTLQAKASTTVNFPTYDISAQVALKNKAVDVNPFSGETIVNIPTGINLEDSQNYMKEVEPFNSKINATGNLKLQTSVGLDIGLSLFQITPLNVTAETGTALNLGGQVDYSSQDGLSGCWTGLQFGMGARARIDVQTQVKTEEKKLDGKFWEKVGVDKIGGGTYGYKDSWDLYNSQNEDGEENKNWDLTKIIKQIGEDTCHKPVISHADWQGGNFISGQYPISFDASATQHEPLIKSVQWDFGDGQKSEKFEDEKIKEGLKPVHTYTKEGIYTATLSVIYDDYGKDAIHTAEWKNIPIKKPAAAIDHYPASGLTGVIGICTTCVEGLVSYDIDWGDGKVESFIMGNQDAQHKHAYASEGSKLVVLTLKDKFNNTFQEARTINVSKSVMAIQGGATQKAGAAAAFSMEKVFSDATSVFWRFFDSIGEVVQSFLKAVSEQVSLVFEDSGDYKVVAEIRSGEGLLETVEQNFQIVSVSQVTPSKAIADKKTLFTLTGNGLNNALVINFDNCDNIIRLGATTTELKFECTPKLIGTGALQLKSQAGVLLWSTDVSFEYAPIQPEQPTQGFSYIVDPLAFMNQGSRYNEPSYWSDSNPVELASYSMEYVQDVNKFAVKTYSTNGSSSNIWKNDPRTQLVFSIQGNKWVEINGGEKQATEGLIGTSGIKTVNITDSQGIQYYTMLERDLTGKMIVEGITSGFGDGRQLPSAANTAMFSDGAKAYTWIRDVLTPNYNIPRTHYVFTTRNDVMPIYACVNIGACSTKVGTLQEAITKQAWLRNGGQSASIQVKSGDKAELLVKDPVTNVNSMYIINYQLINATMGNPVRIIFDTPEAVAKKALSDYFGVNDAQLAWYEYDGQVVRGSYQPPIKGQVSQSYQYNKTAINDILTKWFPSKNPVLD
ncbi:MAG: PKD domain-containing protein [Moraxellaceae bacterium]|nr:PKD domain-containing protein [Moraxellaceae bacterium]